MEFWTAAPVQYACPTPSQQARLEALSNIPNLDAQIHTTKGIACTYSSGMPSLASPGGCVNNLGRGSSAGKGLQEVLQEELAAWTQGFNVSMIALGPDNRCTEGLMMQAASTGSMLGAVLEHACKHVQEGTDARLGLAYVELGSSLGLQDPIAIALQKAAMGKSAVPFSPLFVDITSPDDGWRALQAAQAHSQAASETPSPKHTFVHLVLWQGSGTMTLCSSFTLVGLAAADKAGHDRVLQQQAAGVAKLVSDLAGRQSDTGGTPRVVVTRGCRLSSLLAPLLAGNTRTTMVAVLPQSTGDETKSSAATRLAQQAASIRRCVLRIRGEAAVALPVYTLHPAAALRLKPSGLMTSPQKQPAQKSKATSPSTAQLAYINRLLHTRGGITAAHSPPVSPGRGMQYVGQVKVMGKQVLQPGQHQEHSRPGRGTEPAGLISTETSSGGVLPGVEVIERRNRALKRLHHRLSALNDAKDTAGVLVHEDTRQVQAEILSATNQRHQQAYQSASGTKAANSGSMMGVEAKQTASEYAADGGARGERHQTGDDAWRHAAAQETRALRQRLRNELNSLEASMRRCSSAVHSQSSSPKSPAHYPASSRSPRSPDVRQQRPASAGPARSRPATPLNSYAAAYASRAEAREGVITPRRATTGSALAAAPASWPSTSARTRQRPASGHGQLQPVSAAGLQPGMADCKGRRPHSAACSPVGSPRRTGRSSEATVAPSLPGRIHVQPLVRPSSAPGRSASAPAGKPRDITAAEQQQHPGTQVLCVHDACPSPSRRHSRSPDRVQHARPWNWQLGNPSCPPRSGSADKPRARSARADRRSSSPSSVQQLEFLSCGETTPVSPQAGRSSKGGSSRPHSASLLRQSGASTVVNRQSASARSSSFTPVSMWEPAVQGLMVPSNRPAQHSRGMAPAAVQQSLLSQRPRSGSPALAGHRLLAASPAGLLDCTLPVHHHYTLRVGAARVAAHAESTAGALVAALKAQKLAAQHADMVPWSLKPVKQAAHESGAEQEDGLTACWGSEEHLDMDTRRDTDQDQAGSKRIRHMGVYSAMQGSELGSCHEQDLAVVRNNAAGAVLPLLAPGSTAGMERSGAEQQLRVVLSVLQRERQQRQRAEEQLAELRLSMKEQQAAHEIRQSDLLGECQQLRQRLRALEAAQPDCLQPLFQLYEDHMAALAVRAQEASREHSQLCARVVQQELRLTETQSPGVHLPGSGQALELVRQRCARLHRRLAAQDQELADAKRACRASELAARQAQMLLSSRAATGPSLKSSQSSC